MNKQHSYKILFCLRSLYRLQLNPKVIIDRIKQRRQPLEPPLLASLLLLFRLSLCVTLQALGVPSLPLGVLPPLLSLRRAASAASASLAAASVFLFSFLACLVIEFYIRKDLRKLCGF